MRSRFVVATGLSLLMMATVPALAQPQAPNGYYQQSQNWHGALTPEDQQQFDKNYSKWVDSTRKNDRDDIAESARHMQDIMNRANIPANVPFDQIASNPVPGYQTYPSGAYPANGAYPSNAYPYPAPGQARLAGDDQEKFDKAYAKWVESQRKNDQDDVASSAGKMQEIMARNGIPSNVPFAAIASAGYTAAPGAYPYAYNQPAQRLSSKDQSDFDKDYKHWVDARRKRDMDDVDKNARKMQEIMARYNIPANVAFDQIATVGAYH